MEYGACGDGKSDDSQVYMRVSFLSLILISTFH
jgi:hypothetical protein